MKNTTKKALKAMLILTMLVTLCVALAACAQTTETGATDPIVLELVLIIDVTLEGVFGVLVPQRLSDVLADEPRLAVKLDGAHLPELGVGEDL